jgi:hypothetical protein
LLTCGHYLLIARATTLLEQRAGIAVSTGFLAGVRRRGAVALEVGFLPHMRALLRTAPVLHADETTGRAAGALAYVHVACTEYLTLMHVGGRLGFPLGSDTLSPSGLGKDVLVPRSSKYPEQFRRDAVELVRTSDRPLRAATGSSPNTAPPSAWPCCAESWVSPGFSEWVAAAPLRVAQAAAEEQLASEIAEVHSNRPAPWRGWHCCHLIRLLRSAATLGHHGATIPDPTEH